MSLAFALLATFLATSAATAVSLNDPILHISTSASENSIKTITPLPAIQLPRRDNPWAVYLCTVASWEQCTYHRGTEGTCYNVEDSSLNLIRGFGPDRYQKCRMYDKPNCAEDGSPFTWYDLQYPGLDDIRKVGWGNKLKSWRCVQPTATPIP